MLKSYSKKMLFSLTGFAGSFIIRTEPAKPEHTDILMRHKASRLQRAKFRNFAGLVPGAVDFNANDDWRFDRPVWTTDLCVHCGICYLVCPDAAIFRNAQGDFEVDTTRCKGCGLCVHECWTGAIALEPTTPRPPWLARNF